MRVAAKIEIDGVATKVATDLRFEVFVPLKKAANDPAGWRHRAFQDIACPGASSRTFGASECGGVEAIIARKKVF